MHISPLNFLSFSLAQLPILLSSFSDYILFLLVCFLRLIFEQHARMQHARPDPCTTMLLNMLPALPLGTAAAVFAGAVLAARYIARRCREQPRRSTALRAALGAAAIGTATWALNPRAHAEFPAPVTHGRLTYVVTIWLMSIRACSLIAAPPTTPAALAKPWYNYIATEVKK